MNVKLAKLFIEKGYLSLDNLKEAVEEQKTSNRSLGEILITRGYITELQLVELTNIDNQFPRIDLSSIDIPDTVVKLIPKDTALENNLIPFELDGTFLNVAMIDPTNLVLIDELRFLTGHNIKPYIAEFSNIKNALVTHYNIPAEDVIQKQQYAEKQADSEQEELEPTLIQEQMPEQASAAPTESKPQSYEQPPAAETQQVAGEQTTATPAEPPLPTPPEPSLPTPPQQSVSADPISFQSAAEPKMQSEPEPPKIEEPQFPEQSAPEQQVPEQPVPEQPVASEQVDKAEQKNQNEVIDVFAKDDDDYVKGVKKSADNAFENISLQSSAGSTNLFEVSSEADSALSEQPVDEQTSTPAVEENLFAAPSQKSEPAVGFQPVEAQTAEPAGLEQQPPAQTSAPDLNVFSSSQAPSSADEDKTIELSLEAEEIIEDEPVSQDNDVFSVSPPPDPAEESKKVEDLFKIPGQQQPDIETTESPPESNETDLKAINVDSSYDTIESYNKNVDAVDANGSEAGAQASTEPAKPDLREVEPIAETPAAPPANEPAAEPVAPVQQQYEQPEQTVSKPTVLVVDDSPTVQKIVSVTLSRHGYQVEVSSNAMQALAKLNELIPDVIFLDINLPHMDGYQLCKIIKGNELTKQVPVIMLSGKDGLFDKMRGKMVGATDYITKPFEPNSLVVAIKKQGISMAGNA